MTLAPQRGALAEGTRIEEFEFHRVLGTGGFGITYLGWDLTFDRPVAIKEYLPSDIAYRESDGSVLARSDDVQEDFRWGLGRFLDEARAIARFKHHNIVSVYRYFEANSTAYIVMEYVEGEELGAVFLTGVMALEDWLPFMEGILDGLEEVHKADYLHRDLKPSNVIVRPDGTPVLIDFGAARQDVGTRSRSVTSIVTPGYAPIEQYGSQGKQGPWTDLYAVGALGYEALTGEKPFDATDRVRRDPLVPIAERLSDEPDLAPSMAIDWALQVDEDARPQTVADLRAAIAGELDPPGAPTQEVLAEPELAPTEPDMRPRARRVARGGVPTLLLVLVVLAGAGLGWWAFDRFGLSGAGSAETAESPSAGMDAYLEAARQAQVDAERNRAAREAAEIELRRAQARALEQQEAEVMEAERQRAAQETERLRDAERARIAEAQAERERAANAVLQARMLGDLPGGWALERCCGVSRGFLLVESARSADDIGGVLMTHSSSGAWALQRFAGRLRNGVLATDTVALLPETGWTPDNLLVRLQTNRLLAGTSRDDEGNTDTARLTRIDSARLLNRDNRLGDALVGDWQILFWGEPGAERRNSGSIRVRGGTPISGLAEVRNNEGSWARQDLVISLRGGRVKFTGLVTESNGSWSQDTWVVSFLGDYLYGEATDGDGSTGIILLRRGST